MSDSPMAANSKVSVASEATCLFDCYCAPINVSRVNVYLFHHMHMVLCVSCNNLPTFQSYIYNHISLVPRLPAFLA